jgi:arylsulfatase A-like enzyme
MKKGRRGAALPGLRRPAMPAIVRRVRGGVIGLLVLFLSAAGCGPGDQSQASAEPPSRIILIVVDMLRRDHVGVHGGSTSTPHMDALAKRGQAFEHAVAAYGSTTMSMAALFTGRTPSIETGDRARGLQWNGRSWCGLARFAHEEDVRCVPGNVPTLAERLRAAGYETLGVASNVLLHAPAGFERGFDIWEEPGAEGAQPRGAALGAGRITSGAYGGTLASSVNRAVENVLSRRQSDRFFLYTHFMDAHDYAELGISYPEAVALADAGVGELLAGLEAEGLLADALVILTSDHGERLGETHPVKGWGKHYGNPPFDSLLRVPLIVAPALVKDPRQQVRGQDLQALILDRVGVETEVDARSEEVFVSEWTWQTLREPRWKAMFDRKGRRTLLFDLDADPGEQRNVARDHPAEVDRLRARVSALTVALAKRGETTGGLGAEDRARLEAIGYLEKVMEAEESSINDDDVHSPPPE